MRIDLHSHSNVSDGTDSPVDLVVAAKAAGLDVIALTDHDCLAGWVPAQAAADAHGIVLVPGVEMTTKHEDVSVHLLVYWPDADNEEFNEALDRIVQAREDRLPKMLANLQSHGIEVTEAMVRACAGDALALGRPHVADAMIALGVVRDRDEAFRDWLAEGRPGFVAKVGEPATADAIGLARRAGGVPVIAHPGGRKAAGELTEEVLKAWVGLGLVGLEVDHQDHDEATRTRLRAMAAVLGLVPTGSSDYHGTGKVNHDLGVNLTSPEAFAALQSQRGAVTEQSARLS